MKGTQIGLQLPPVIALSADNFLFHSGVQPVRKTLQHAVRDLFSISSVYSEHRAGCSHLAVALHQEFDAAGFNVHSLEGLDVEAFLSQDFSETSTDARSVYLIDDSDFYFLSDPTSGPFVSFVEHCRYQGGHIILFTHTGPADLPCDDHIMSRLHAGTTCVISFPEDAEYPELIRELARQRGIVLSLWQAQFISKRIGRGFDEVLRYLRFLGYVQERASGTSMRSCINSALMLFQEQLR